MWSRWGAIAALSAGLLAIAAPAAHAESPVDLNGAYVLDEAGVVSGEEGSIEEALDSLYTRAGIQLFVVYVDSFTGAADGEWANDTAVRNGLGASDVLLAIAVEDRNFQLSVDQESALTDDQLAAVENDYLIPQLRDDNWADAAIAAAEGLADQATGSSTGTGTGTDGTDGTEDGSAPAAAFPVLPVVGGVAVVGAGIFVVSRLRKRSSAAPKAPERMPLKDLERRAGSLLVQLDDSLKTSEQELGFAVAQFGDAATADFTAALAGAKAKVAEAFTLKQRLDDHEPDAETDQRAWNTRIIELCEAADAELDAQADAFDDLRQLEKNAPQELAAVRTAITAANERRSAAEAALGQLQSRFAPTATQPVSENVAQAGRVLAFAQAAADKGQEAVAAGRSSEAAIAVRTAQASVGQATQLYDAIDTLSTGLTDAASRLDAAVADTRQDIVAASALPGDDPALSPAIATAQSALDAATANAKDPVASLAALGQANAALDQVFVSVRDEQEQVRRATAQLDAALAAARSQITTAAEFISTRRGGVQENARTRVSEADRHLTQATALAATDPVAALTEARQAQRLGEMAYASAQADVESLQNRNSSSSLQYGYDDGPDLGGLLTGWLLGGGGGGGYSGGSNRSSWGGGGGSSWSSSSRSSRSSRSGSFGGSSRSSGRSSGGRRSRGGRF